VTPESVAATKKAVEATPKVKSLKDLMDETDGDEKPAEKTVDKKVKSLKELMDEAGE
jgi:hypothetical protein